MEKFDSEWLSAHTIAQDDDNDYDESGYVCITNDGAYEIHRYSHCSCYGTDECLQNNPSPDWRGSEEELIALAKARGDLTLFASIGKLADPEDYDYDHLMAVYDQILAHFKVEREEVAT